MRFSVEEEYHFSKSSCRKREERASEGRKQKGGRRRWEEKDLGRDEILREGEIGGLLEGPVEVVEDGDGGLNWRESEGGEGGRGETDPAGRSRDPRSTP